MVKRNNFLSLNIMNDCIFCKIVKGEIHSYKIYEDDDVYAFLDINPVSRGHTLVVPKEHYADIFEIPEDLLSKVNIVVKKLSSRIKERLECDGINILQNNGSCAGQTVLHYHVHIQPVYVDSKIDESLESVCRKLCDTF